jgi:hypothetical protein
MENIQDVQIQNLRGLMNMTFSLPEIQISSSNLYTALKIIFLVGGFITIVFNVLSVSADTNTDYNFVYCYNEVTNSTFTYPEGTSCELTDDDLQEEEEKQDEKDHAEEEDN